MRVAGQRRESGEPQWQTVFFGLCDYVRTVEAREAFVVTSFGLCDYKLIGKKKVYCA